MVELYLGPGHRQVPSGATTSADTVMIRGIKDCLNSWSSSKCYYIILDRWAISLSCAEAGNFRETWTNIVAADVLAACVPWLSTAMLLTIQDKRVFFFREKGFQLFTPAQCHGIITTINTLKRFVLQWRHMSVMASQIIETRLFVQEFVPVTIKQ